jgi:hypothetical protein
VTAGLSLGAPGIYFSAVPPPAAVQPIRLDQAGFVGLAWRGPANTPVRTTSWSQFVDVFGGVTAMVGDGIQSCPGYLPRAVRAFFDQGGEVAWVCRVVPRTDDPSATARYVLAGGRALVAASEGSWGGRLRVTLSFQSRPPLPAADRTASDAVAPAADELVLPDILALPAGSLLLVGPSADHPAGTLHWLMAQALRPALAGGRVRVISVDPPLPEGARSRDGGVDVRVVTATLDVTDQDPLRLRAERVAGLGLHPDHPRYPARPLPPDHPAYPGTVLSAESLLVRTADGWADPILPADGTLPDMRAGSATDPHGGAGPGGEDRFHQIGIDSFFDDDSPDGDLLDERDDHRGVDRLTRLPDLGLLCVPDLTWSTGTEATVAGTTAMVVDEWQGAGHLDPQDPSTPAETARRQQRLIAVADLRERFVALIDAPSRLSVSALTRWRSGLDSAFAAAYYPWLRVPGDDADRLAVPVPPSAVAAGVIAARERRRGLAWGPANEIAVGVVLADDLVPDAVHDELHLAGINVFRAERDGFRLTAARTLSSDPRYRQLSVRRLMTMIVLSVEREAQALVFEPNTTGLRAVVTHALTEFLRDLYRQGAFAGDTEQSSFFVRCDDRLNPPESLALGRLITEIGVALSSPLEYLVLRISQDVDGTAAVTPVASPAAAVPASLLTADAMRRAGA